MESANDKRSAETARDLELDFGHADLPCGLSGFYANGGSGFAGDLRRIHFKRRYENRRTGFWNSGNGQNDFDRWTTGATLRPPYRASNVNACNTVDTQAGYESMMALWPTIMSHCNFVKHAAGRLEGGLCASFEKVIVAVELLQMMLAFLDELSFSKDEMAFEAIADAGPGGHFFGTQHTLDRYETAFYPPILSDWNNFGQWTEDGAFDTTQRANRI